MIEKSKVLLWIKRWLLTTVFIQVALSCISLPILGSWGMSTSTLSLIGNIVFAPFLSAILLLSSLIFFGSLLGLPTGWISLALDAVARWWLQLMDCNVHHCLIPLGEFWWAGYLLIPTIILTITLIQWRVRNAWVLIAVYLLLAAAMTSLLKK